MRFLIGLLVTLLAISIAYPAALLVLAIPIVVLISVARERIKYQVAHRYPAHRHPATRAREYTQIKTKPCTAGSPCKIGHRRVVRDLQGNRVATLCIKCDRQENWQPFITGK
jgi:hypothetical protein